MSLFFIISEYVNTQKKIIVMYRTDIIVMRGFFFESVVEHALKNSEKLSLNFKQKSFADS